MGTDNNVSLDFEWAFPPNNSWRSIAVKCVWNRLTSSRIFLFENMDTKAFVMSAIIKSDGYYKKGWAKKKSHKHSSFDLDVV